MHTQRKCFTESHTFFCACCLKVLIKVFSINKNFGNFIAGEEESSQAPAMVAAQQSFEVPLSPIVSVEGVSNSAVPLGPPNFPLKGEKRGRWAAITQQLSPKLSGYFSLLDVTYEKVKQLEVSTQKQAE